MFEVRVNLTKLIERLKKDAKTLSRNEKISHSQALHQLAISNNYPHWKALLKAEKKELIKSTPSPVVSNKFATDSDFQIESAVSNEPERDFELPDEIKLSVAENRELLAKAGIEYAIFEPTNTGLKKKILDATQSVNTLFKFEKLHVYSKQKQGPEFKIIKKAYFLDNSISIETKCSLYRPKIKKGDPRMWFTNLADFATATEQIAIIVYDDSLYLINLSRLNLADLSKSSLPWQLVDNYLKSKNGFAIELLEKLKEIALQGSICAGIQGSTSVGLAVESALKIKQNSSKAPDYNGIELKSARGNKQKSRTTLFAQVPDWNKSPLKSSAEILDKFGYKRGDDFKLYCTLSTQKINSQGLSFFYDESSDLLKEQCGKELVAVWQGSHLCERLLTKHAETFWIDATSTIENGAEYFQLTAVTHTKSPLITQFLTLIENGVITMDHLIKRKGNEISVTEKGPLFKINKRDLEMLFPSPIKYSLLT